MKKYYFLASYLPTLEIGHIPGLGFAELHELLKINLNSEDLLKTVELRRQIDVENMRALWAREPLDPRGNLKQQELEQALVDLMWSPTEDFPLYLIDFLTTWTTADQRLYHFPKLLSEFFTDDKSLRKGFLEEYFMFQKQWRLVLLGFRCKILDRDLPFELQFEDQTDPLIAQILAQKDAKIYEPPFEFKELKPLFEYYQDQPLELHRALYSYQFDYLVDRWGGDLFSIDRILNYMARLLLVERWLELNLQQGMNVIDTIERNVS